MYVCTYLNTNQKATKMEKKCKETNKNNEDFLRMPMPSSCECVCVLWGQAYFH